MKTVRFISTLVVLIAVLLAATSCGQRKTVTVPDVTGKCPVDAYDVLHEAGLHVSTGELNAEVASENPPGGTAVHGAVVTLTFGPATHFGGMCGVPTRAVETPAAPVDRAPDLIGKTLEFAFKESVHGVYVEVENPALPPLHDADGSDLYDNYVVSKQSPSPGTPLRPISASNPPGNPNMTVTATSAN